MRLIRGTFRKFKCYFSNISLLKKMTFAYIVAILIPTIAMGGLSLYQSQRYIQDEVVKTMGGLVLQTKANLISKLEVAENMGRQVTFNSRFQRFLSREFRLSPDSIEEYLDYIYPFVDNARSFHQVDIYNIRVFMTNDSIPEAWGIFYNVSRIHGQKWYKDFIKGSSDSMWLYRDTADIFKLHRPEDLSRVFSYIRKIYSMDNRFLGVVVIDIRVDELLGVLQPVDNGQWMIYMSNQDDIILFGNRKSNSLDIKLMDRYGKDTAGHFVHSNNLYLYERIKPLDLTMVYKVPMKPLVKSSRTGSVNMILSVIVGVLFLEVTTYMILKMLFSKIREIVGTMNNVARGDFKTRIPVEGNDEISQMAKDFNILIERINTLVGNLVQKEIAQKDAQLKALQYQINPHFIYNTIDSFRMKMVLNGEYETADAIADFGKLLRYNMSDKSMYATIGEEVDYVEKYFSLQKFRYGSRVSMSIELPERLRNAKILKFILQPVVENSLNHGLIEGTQRLSVRIAFSIDNDLIVIMVEDDGAGIEPGRLEQINDCLCGFLDSKEPEYNDDKSSIGLININKRLKLYYGEQYYIRMESEKGKYTRTILGIPYEELKEQYNKTRDFS